MTVPSWIHEAYQQLTWWSSSVKIITSQDLLSNKFILVIWSWPSSKLQGGFLRSGYYGYDLRIHPLAWSTLSRRTRSRMRAWPARWVPKQWRPCCTRHTRFESQGRRGVWLQFRKDDFYTYIKLIYIVAVTVKTQLFVTIYFVSEAFCNAEESRRTSSIRHRQFRTFQICLRHFHTNSRFVW